MNQNEKHLLDELNIFIELLKDVYKSAKREDSNKHKLLWKRPNTFKKGVIDNLVDLNETYNSDPKALARFTVGLSKHIDFYYFGWCTDPKRTEIRKMIREIVLLSNQIITPHLKPTSVPYIFCGCEDEACIKGKAGPGWNNDDKDITFKDNSGSWPNLPAEEIQNFLDRPKAYLLEPGVHLYRIVGEDGNPYGSYWLFDYILHSRPFWRHYFSVKKNGIQMTTTLIFLSLKKG